MNKISTHSISRFIFAYLCLLPNKRGWVKAILFFQYIYSIVLICLLSPASTYTATARPMIEVSVQPVDSVTIRSFKKANLEKYLSDEEYRYDREFRPQAPNLWQRFKQWLFDKLIQALGDENTSNLVKWTIYIICGAVILYVILKLTNTNIRGLIYNQSQRGRLAFQESEENIHQLDFATLLKEAIAKGDYSRAIRLYYLRTLKTLSDKNIIDWRINKTNHDYVQELSNTELASGFRSLTILFEYICYGDFHMNQADFEEASAQFNAFDEQVLSKNPSISKAATHL